MRNHRRRIIRTKVPLAEISGVFAVLRSIDPRAFNEVRRLAENAASEFYGYAGPYTGYGGNTYFVFSDEQALPNARKASAFRLRMDSAGRVSGHGPEGGCLNLCVSRRQAKI